MLFISFKGKEKSFIPLLKVYYMCNITLNIIRTPKYGVVGNDKWVRLNHGYHTQSRYNSRLRARLRLSRPEISRCISNNQVWWYWVPNSMDMVINPSTMTPFSLVTFRIQPVYIQLTRGQETDNNDDPRWIADFSLIVFLLG